MKKLIIALLLGSLCLNATVFAATGVLDGKTYKGKMIEKGKAKGDPDKLIFKDGMFVSTACAEVGYPEAPYRTIGSGESMTFEGTAANQKDGSKMQWKGSVNGNKITATAMNLAADGSTNKEYSFNGKIKDKSKEK